MDGCVAIAGLLSDGTVTLVKSLDEAMSLEWAWPKLPEQKQSMASTAQGAAALEAAKWKKAEEAAKSAPLLAERELNIFREMLAEIWSIENSISFDANSAPYPEIEMELERFFSVKRNEKYKDFSWIRLLPA